MVVVMEDDEVSFPQICSALVDKKGDLSEKVVMLKKLKFGGNEYEQIIVDWICATVEYTSNTDKYIALNANEINQLLQVLVKRLQQHVICEKEHNSVQGFPSKGVIIKPKMFGVLVRFLSDSSYDIIDEKSLVSMWRLLLQNEGLRKNLSSKVNLAALEKFIEVCMNEEQQNVNVDISADKLEVIEKLLECFVYYCKSQFISRKILNLFCEKLLVKLLWLKGYFANIENQPKSNICTLIRNILIFVLCSKDQIASLKELLKSLLKGDSAMEVDKPLNEDTNNKDNSKKDSTNNKDNFAKDAMYFSLVFKEISKVESAACDNVLHALPDLYDLLISSVRSSSQASLTRPEEMFLLVHLNRCLEFTNTVNHLQAIQGMLKIVIKHDVFQRASDDIIGKTFSNWLLNILNLLMKQYPNGNNKYKKLSLNIMLNILNISHVIVEPHLSGIWEICLCNSKEEENELLLATDTLLCEVLAVYEKLHQINVFLSNFSIAKIIDDSDITYPANFISNYQKSLSRLLPSQIVSLLDIAIVKLKEAHAKFTTSSQLDCCSLAQFEHEAYILCYLVLNNTSLIPSNGYRKKETDLLVEKLGILKELVKGFSSFTTTTNARFRTSCSRVQLLLQCGINSVVIVLKEFALLNNEEDFLLDVKGCMADDHLDSNDFITKYLMVTSFMNELDSKDTKGDVVSKINTVYEEYQKKNDDDSCGEWNGQILSINSSNFSTTLVNLYEDNLSAVLSSGDQSLISIGFSLVWKHMSSWSTDESCAHNKTSSKLILKSLPCYNSLQFQNCLLRTIYQSFLEGLSEDHKQIMEYLLAGSPSYPRICEIKNSVNNSASDEILSEKPLQCLNIFRLVQEVPLTYLTEHSLYVLSMLIIFVWVRGQKLITNVYKDKCVGLLSNIMDVYASGNPQSCHLPVKFVFTYSLNSAVNSDCGSRKVCEDLCLSTIRTIINYTSKEDEEVIEGICSDLKEELDKENPSTVLVQLVCKILDVLCKILLEPTVKSRCENTTYKIVTLISESVMKLIARLNKDDNDNQDVTFLLFSNLCRITQHAQSSKDESSPLKHLELNLSKMFSDIDASLSIELSSDSKDERVGFLQVLEFLYESNNQFTVDLRKLQQNNEEQLLSLLLTNANKGRNVNKIAQLIPKIILLVEEDKLKDLLQLVCDKLLTEHKNTGRKWMLEIWTVLLAAKWEKNQRIILWEYLPKVIITCVHMTKSMKTSEDIVLLLRLIINAVSIGRNSLMSQYVNVIYHVFVMLPKQIEEAQYGNFLHLFEEIYQLASQLLFHHQSAIFPSLHGFINCLTVVFQILSSYHASKSFNTEDSLKCSDRMSRLYRELGNHKTPVAKYSPYIIPRFIRTCLTSSLSGEEKKLIERGVYCVLDTCSDDNFAFLGATLDKADKEYFKLLKINYDKHYKFTGKA